MKTKSAMITIAGRPNVGKSTLTNYLVGEKIAIVSNKPQTTRNRICGIVTRGDTQFVFVDTPGYHRARTKLGDYMVNVARESISDVDLTILVVEPIASIGPQEEGLIDKIKSSHCPAILAINKIDTVEKDALLEVIAVYSQAAAFDAIIPISAHTGSGLKDLMKELRKYAQEGPQLFPDGMTTDQPERQVMGEILREKLLLCLIEGTWAAVALAEATARAVQRIPDAHCNGDMHAALDYAAGVKHKQKEFLAKQGVHAILDT